MSILTPLQLQQVKDLVDDLHKWFLIRVLGESAVSASDRRKLKAKGYTWGAPLDTPLNAYQFGVLADQLRRQGKKVPFTYQEFRKFLKENPIPMTVSERESVAHINRSITVYTEAMADEVKGTTGAILVNAEKKMRRKLEGALKRELSEGVEKRKTVKEVASALREATKDYATNFERIASTELNNAYQEGVLHGIQTQNKGRDPLVYKLPRPDACSECADHYLHDGSKKPRVFRLSELLANGSNVGRKRAERKPVIDSAHPWCRCQLFELPPGFDLDANGNQIWQGIT